MPSPRTLLRCAEWALLTLLLVACWISILDLPAYVAYGDGLDMSWQQALGHFFKHRSQAGADYVFTYGPLGYFYTSVYDADLFWPKYAWELGVKLLLVFTLALIVWRLPHVLLRVSFCLLYLVFVPEPALAAFSADRAAFHFDLLHRTDGMYGFFVLTLGTLPWLLPRPSLRFLLPAAGALAVLSLIKFNLAVLTVIALLSYSLFLLTSRGWRLAGLPVAGYGLSLLGTWLLLGQALGHLPAYYHGSLEIAEGYVEAMAYTSEPILLTLAITLFGGLTGVAISYGRAFLGNTVHLLFLALLGASGFVMWKQGFVRHGMSPVVFFNFMLLVPFLFVAACRDAVPSWPRKILLSASVLLAMVGRLGSHDEERQPLPFLAQRAERLFLSAHNALHPFQLRAALEDQQRELEQYFALPRVRAAVGDATIDQVSYEQAILLLNHLHYQPRPVFQGYSVYTPYLLSLNAAFYRSEAAPAFVLFRLETIDDRLPAQEDSLAFLEIVQRYQLMLTENNYLLLRRTPRGETASATSGRVLLDRVIEFGEEVRVDGLLDRYQTMTLEMDYSAWGKARKLLYQPPQVQIEVYLNHETDPVAYRLIPAIAKAGFLLNPCLQTTQDVQSLYEGREPSRARAFRITTSSEGRRCFLPTMRLKLHGLAELPNRPIQGGG